MKLIDLIRTHSWLNVKDALFQEYPDQGESEDAYEEVFNHLKSLSVSESDMIIVLKKVTDDFDDEEYIDVSGRSKEGDYRTNGQEESFALEFTPWAKWLGMDIDKGTLTNFSESEIIAHCLFEMTFIGFDEESIQAEMDELKKRIEQWDAMSKEEKEANSYSTEELIKKLGLDDDEEDK